MPQTLESRSESSILRTGLQALGVVGGGLVGLDIAGEANLDFITTSISAGIGAVIGGWGAGKAYDAVAR